MHAITLQNAVKNMEKQKKCLETRIAFADGLKQSPLMTMYCNLDQLVLDLEMGFQDKDAVESLKKFPDISFSIDGDTIKSLDNLGTIASVYSPACQSTPSRIEIVKDSQHLDVKPKPRNTRLRLKSCAKDLMREECESDIGYMKTDDYKMDTTSQLTSGKNLHTFQESQTLSSPDVIIEEIIEEDQSCDGLLESQNNTAFECSKEKLVKKEFSDCKPKRFKKNEKMMGASAPFCQKKNPLELVYLSHLINPCNLYVHRIAHRRQIIILERMLTTLGQKCSHCGPIDVLELGEIIAFRSVAYNKWCRGSIIELIPLESKCILKPCGPTRYKIEDITRLTLFLLDYGGSETFVALRFAGGCVSKSDPAVLCETKVSDLHTLLIKLSSAQEEGIRFMPPFAVHCSLDVVPRSPDGLWPKEVKNHILKMVGNKCVSMKVLREEHDKLIVDLKKPFGNKINTDMPVSLRDALIFMELATIPSNTSTALNHMTVAYYKDPVLPNNMSEVCVLICYSINPSDFYIHMIGESEYSKTVNEIQEVYNSEEAEDWQIVSPSVGQPCIAKYDVEDDNDQWYRAEIVALPNPYEAIINYVDFGNIAKVDVVGLRRMKDEFMDLPRKAICCRLAYIQPPNAGPIWSSDACLLFDKLTGNKQLRCTSLGVLLENKLSVEIFDIDPSNVTSINTMLVEEKVASYIQCKSDSRIDHLPVQEVWDPVTNLLPDSEEEYMDNISLFERKEIEVYISHVVSPSKIFIRWLTSQNIIKNLQANMLERYENSKPEAIQWQVDMMVAVEYDKKWRRAKVTKVISDNQVEVFCYDYGLQEVTNVTNLRTLDESFMVYGSMCLECSLMDIKPAGGSQNWTATACDLLSSYLCGATVTVIIEDNASSWPLPVRILCKDESQQLVDISEFLVKKGLALRDRRMNSSNSLLEVKDKNTKLSAKNCPQEPKPVKDIKSEPESESVVTVTSEQSNITEPVMESMVDEPYLPPVLPDQKTFLAKVHHIAEDGTIYVVQECLENDLVLLMLEIQNSFKCLGLMAPYSWKKGEGCLVKGSDTMLYRGKVVDILGGDMITVQYEDFGYTEKIPKCHLYPSVYNPHTPRYGIPCQLSDILPVGELWQPDAIQFLKELLLERIDTVYIVEPPKDSHDSASVRIYCGNASVSAILELYNHGLRIDRDINNNIIETNYITDISQENIWQIDFQELLQNDYETPLLPKYSSESLPGPGELFKAKVTHIETPDIVWICIVKKGQTSGSGDGDCDPLQFILNKLNTEENELPYLTDFRTAMPCLAVYGDGLLHRAKLQSIKCYNPVSCLMEFVDYGSTKVVDTNSLFQLPESLIQYPAKAIKVKLAGFKPPKNDPEIQRISYCPMWSMKAMTEMMDMVGGKTYTSTCIAGPEKTVFLYDDNQELVHKPLIAMGLAELDDM
ncbi:RING finger protein 17 [Leptodactylus fuscus]|uniref:RING finger protein 17 n=1 Tax=Leptodactylus fuscus TaxID=238119 RepID=UPI003F4EEE56